VVNEALDAITKFAVIVVLLTHVGEVTVIPVPLTEMTTLEQVRAVPVNVTGTVVPTTPLIGLMLVIVGTTTLKVLLATSAIVPSVLLCAVKTQFVPVALPVSAKVATPVPPLLVTGFGPVMVQVPLVTVNVIESAAAGLTVTVIAGEKS
jgi:hypothetical protein